MTPKSSEQLRIEKQMDEGLDDVMRVRSLSDEIHARYEADSYNGYSSRSFDAMGTGGSDPTAAAGTRPHRDPTTRIYRNLCEDVQQWWKLSQRIATHAANLRAMDAEEARKAAEESSAKVAYCLECDRMVPQTARDHLRGGKCMTCYQRERRARLGDEDVA